MLSLVHSKYQKKLSLSMLLMECTGRCACASQHSGTDACSQMSAFFSCLGLESLGSPLFVVSLWGVLFYVCVCVCVCVYTYERERQSKPVWSDKPEFNSPWWSYTAHMRRRADRKQRWFPFFAQFCHRVDRKVQRSVWILSLWTTATIWVTFTEGVIEAWN